MFGVKTAYVTTCEDAVAFLDEHDVSLLLLNEIAHKAALGDMFPGSEAAKREYLILDINGGVLFDSLCDRSEALTVETAMQKNYPCAYIIENNQITGSLK